MDNEGGVTVAEPKSGMHVRRLNPGGPPGRRVAAEHARRGCI